MQINMFKKKNKTRPEKSIPPTKFTKDKKWLLWGLIGFTGILLITAVVLFMQLKKPAPVPTPKPKPKASPVAPVIKEVAGEGVCEVAFSIVEPSPSPSPSPSVSPSPSPSPIGCFDDGCTGDSDCTGDLRCLEVAGIDRCVNASCPEDIDCVCPGASPSPSPSPSSSP